MLGLVLGNMCEQNFSRGYLMSKGSILMMFNPTLHPIAFVLIIVCIAAGQPGLHGCEEKEGGQVRQISINRIGETIRFFRGQRPPIGGRCFGLLGGKQHAN